MAKPSFELPVLNRFSSRKEWEEACWKAVSKSEKLLSVVTTSYERHNIVLRALAIEYMNSGKKYRQIAEELYLSPQTVSSIKKVLDGRLYQSYRERGKLDRRPKIYSPNLTQKKRKPLGRSIRTKYGTIRI
ncbi:MAG: response regulator transcription factor [Candidatus Liptonbacteria bacterium]|nr:response regulator transcription factor [Candidatus Liptonbacteria bacterium]